MLMPFTKNDPKTKEWGKMGGHARERWVLEPKQLERLKELTGQYIFLSEKDELTVKEKEKMLRIEKLVLKAMDKLHPSKSDMKVEVDKPLMIL